MVGTIKFRKQFGRNLRQLREQMGYMQVDVAAATDLDRTYISKIETGKARVTLEILLKLVKGLEITSDDLFSNEDNNLNNQTSAGDNDVTQISMKHLKWKDAPIWIKIGRNIKNCRKWKGLTPEEVATKSGIDLKRYKRIERQLIKDITHYETFMIANALNMDDEEIICH